MEPRSAAFQAIVDRKSHLALELGILLQGVSAPMLGREAKSKLDRFSAELSANARLLDRHIGAVRELSTIIAREIETAGADGTYSPTIATRRGAA